MTPELAEPWHMEMKTLRHVNFLDINNRLAKCKKRLYDEEECTAEDVLQIRYLLHAQGIDVPEMNVLHCLE